MTTYDGAECDQYHMCVKNCMFCSRFMCCPYKGDESFGNRESKDIISGIINRQFLNE